MAVPKRRSSKSRAKKRNSHKAKTPIQLSPCPQCSEMTPSHVVCPKCGHYQGRTLVEPEE